MSGGYTTFKLIHNFDVPCLQLFNNQYNYFADAFNVSHIVNTLKPLKCKLYLKFNLESNMILVMTNCM